MSDRQSPEGDLRDSLVDRRHFAQAGETTSLQANLQVGLLSSCAIWQAALQITAVPKVPNYDRGQAEPWLCSWTATIGVPGHSADLLASCLQALLPGHSAQRPEA